jgi:hypothetical protein
MRKVYYIYNPKTRTYDRIYPTVRQRALSILRRLFVGMGLGAGSFIILLLIFGSPSEKEYLYWQRNPFPHETWLFYK